MEISAKQTLEGRIAIVTGAGGGLGRAHALALAARGASVVVNDFGVDVSGARTASQPALVVTDEIRARGGRAVASGHDVSDWRQAGDLIALAVEKFGDLHVLVNNAGILRDRALHNLEETEWDHVVGVHLKGHAATTHHAFRYWRTAAKAGAATDRSVVMTTSIAGLSGNFGQAAYGSAKAGILGLSAVAGIEGAAIGVRSNAVSPGAKTRIALAVPGASDAYDVFAQAHSTNDFDPVDPANVSGLIAWLADAACPASRQLFHITADQLVVASMPRPVHEFSARGHCWTPEMLHATLAQKLLQPINIDDWGGFPEGFFQSGAPQQMRI